MRPFCAKKDVSNVEEKETFSDERLYAQEHEELQAANRASAPGPVSNVNRNSRLRWVFHSPSGLWETR